MNTPESERMMQTIVDVATHPDCWKGVTAGLAAGDGDARLVKKAIHTWPGFFIVDNGRSFLAFEPDPDEPNALRAHIACLPEARGVECVEWAKNAVSHVLKTSSAKKIIAVYPRQRRDVSRFCAAVGLRREAPGRHIIERNTLCHS